MSGYRRPLMITSWCAPKSLSCLPCLVDTAHSVGSWRRGIGGPLLRRLACADRDHHRGLHVGYEQYRPYGVGAPRTGNTLISMPMLLSTNPIGSIADHMAMHVSVVAHTNETDVRLPPPTTAD